ncbi:MAG: hypothetical protein HY550_06710 [Elusimicrobia bacterium]|nr:hypothetical protein [Elusimicrobiota bacterium]
MEEEKKRAGWKIWVYLSPVYIVLGALLFRWNAKINSSDVGLSKEEYNVFNASEGEIKKRGNTDYDPALTDSGYSVRYRSGKEEESAMYSGGTAAQTGKAAAGREQERKNAAAGQGGQGQAGQAGARTAGQLALESSDTRAKEQMGLGRKEGYLSYAVGKVMNNPKAVAALMNNEYIVNGFMSRGTVKAATASPQGLANYLSGSGPANFMNNPVVKAAMNNPALVSAVASSGMVAAMLNTPAAQALMKDPQAVADLINNNPQLMTLAMQNPQTLTLLLSNPEVSGLVGKFDTTKVNKF